MVDVVMTPKSEIVMEVCRIMYPLLPTLGEIERYWRAFYDIPENWEATVHEAVQSGILFQDDHAGAAVFGLTGLGRELFRAAHPRATRIEAMCCDHIDELWLYAQQERTARDKDAQAKRLGRLLRREDH